MSRTSFLCCFKRNANILRIFDGLCEKGCVKMGIIVVNAVLQNIMKSITLDYKDRFTPVVFTDSFGSWAPYLSFGNNQMEKYNHDPDICHCLEIIIHN